VSRSIMPWRLLRAAAIAAALSLFATSPASARTLYLSPSGSDANGGSLAAPLRTLNKAISVVGRGDSVFMRAGTYGAINTTTRMNKSGTASAPIVFARYPGDAKPVILGNVKITGSYTRFDGLVFDGPTGRVKTPTSDNPNGEQVEVAVDGATTFGVQITNSEIRDSLWHAGIYLGNAYDVRITNNFIHDNGNRLDPAQANLCHGIYFSSGSGTIANNLIAHNVARGVQLYPTPRNVVVEQNTIVRNGKAGVQFANDTAGSIAVNNIVAYNGDTGIRSASLVGTGNRAVRNVVWSNASTSNVTGIAMSGNLTGDPRFLGEADYRLQEASPAVDSADPSWSMLSDIDGFARPLGRGPDIGAYEAH
jgi:hypothetical protein